MKGMNRKGCELCGDWPVILLSRCHPTAPLRAEMVDKKHLFSDVTCLNVGAKFLG